MNLTETNDLFASDDDFDSLFPAYIQKLSRAHWTPLDVAREASAFLVEGGKASIIDVGAGVGKFCMAGAHYTHATYTGIEQRPHFVKAGNKVIKKLGLEHTTLIEGNFTDLDLAGFSGIYFYNSFHENLVFGDVLDNKVERSAELYTRYTTHFFEQLNQMPAGTRLGTYYLNAYEIPRSYKLQRAEFKGLLKLWVKEK